MKKDIAIIGTGGLGREIAGIIECINNVSATWNFLGFFDDFETRNEVNGYPVLGGIKELNAYAEDLSIVVGLGNPVLKKKIVQKISNQHLAFPVIIHPSVQIYSLKTISLGKGIVIGANAVITVNVTINDFVYVNTATVVAHDAVVGEFSMLMPTVSISAGAEIGAGVYIGNGVKIDVPIKIIENTILKAGTIISAEGNQ
ncbi:acetyltransferase [Bacteroidota bacterium]